MLDGNRKEDKKDSLSRAISERNARWSVEQHRNDVVCPKLLYRISEPGLEIELRMVDIPMIQNVLTVSL